MTMQRVMTGLMTMGLAMAASSAGAQMKPVASIAPQPACPVQPAALPAAFAAFAHPVALTSGSTLTIGRAAAVTQIAKPAFAIPPAKAPASGDTGATVVFTVDAAGRYRVALDAGVWVDVVANGAALPSVGHGHGPACSPIKKMVDFDFTPGRYTLQLSGARASVVTVEVAKIG